MGHDPEGDQEPTGEQPLRRPIDLFAAPREVAVVDKAAGPGPRRPSSARSHPRQANTAGIMVDRLIRLATLILLRGPCEKNPALPPREDQRPPERAILCPTRTAKRARSLPDERADYPLHLSCGCAHPPPHAGQPMSGSSRGISPRTPENPGPPGIKQSKRPRTLTWGFAARRERLEPPTARSVAQCQPEDWCSRVKAPQVRSGGRPASRRWTRGRRGSLRLACA